jgi:hypothetical protein
MRSKPSGSLMKVYECLRLCEQRNAKIYMGREHRAKKTTALDDAPNFRPLVVDSRPLRRRLAKGIRIQSLFMKKTKRNRRQVRSRKESHILQAVGLPAIMTELICSSFETIARRSWMLAQGKCSPTEIARMVLEKQQALSLSGIALLSGASAASILAPFHRGATANAKRLRGK